VVTEDQSELIAFLSRPETYGPACPDVERIETHSAVVFLAGDRAFKLKRAVRYDYLDFSTADRRRRFVEAELALNRPAAPSLYVRVATVTRDAGGRLHLDGPGRPVEWLLEMTRFDNDQLCDRLAERGALPLDAMPALARAVAALHDRAARRPEHGGAAGIRWVVDGNQRAFDEFGDEVFRSADRRRLASLVAPTLAGQTRRLDDRQRGGFVRQCHGDLHLRNLVMLDGRPTPFDAVEFNDEIAGIDVMYDLAFLLMDLWRRELRAHANAVVNEYCRVTEDVDGLALLPLFLSCRAAVRAKTSATSASLADQTAAPPLVAAAREYLRLAARFLEPPPAVLAAIGGPSGTGKSTIARAIASDLGPAPGALVLRSDVIRKMLRGVGPDTPLGADAYTADASARVYARLAELAKTAVAAGHAVICDAVFAQRPDREALARLAADLGVSFRPIWLDAPLDVLTARVAGRRGDASDATPAVVRQQLAQLEPPDGWAQVDAAGDLGTTIARVRECLGV
jgi:aminoglycoside phosphotransferase family enzyme/predicted kinase